ncbi:MAG TPA: glutamyl-tRNA reductase [Streptosporangiaceae bacterium]|nr:glutamyl-tRNA reductase [Streptosporangiaceae bacterium]
MSVLVVGLSHRSAPVAVLEQAAVSGEALNRLVSGVYNAEHIAGSFVVSTCNRVEVYAEVDQFHAGVSAICDLLAQHSGAALSQLTPHLYVHYDERAAQHLLSVACGLESMVVGESQILGQVRQALAHARRHGTLGRALEDLGVLALRAAKRAHSETGIDRAGANLVSVGIALAASRPPAGPQAPRPAPAEHVLKDWRVLVVGAGSMSSLAVVTADRLGAGHIAVANRTPERAARLAASVSGTTVRFGELAAAIAEADLVISCTGATGLVVTENMVAQALALRSSRRPSPNTAPLVFLDLALPRDVDPAVAGMPGVSLVGLETLQGTGNAVREEDVGAVRAIVAAELDAWAAARQAARVAPTVVALRAKAAGVVEAELARLGSRLGDMDEHARMEITLALHRVVEKLLHAPTVRVKELAGSPNGHSYEAALRVLFDLDPATIESVTKADTDLAPTDAVPNVLAPVAEEAR